MIGLRLLGAASLVVWIVFDLARTDAAAAPHYTATVLLRPSAHLQVRTFQIRPDSLECSAIQHVRPDTGSSSCYDELTLTLGIGARRGRWTVRYAAIRQCVARHDHNQVKVGCVQFLRTCARPLKNPCPPAWTAQTSLMFASDGKRVRAQWITCGTAMSQGFRYHLNWCGTTRGDPPTEKTWLSAGDDYELRIPGVVQVGTEERISIRPDGALLFRGCC